LAVLELEIYKNSPFVGRTTAEYLAYLNSLTQRKVGPLVTILSKIKNITNDIQGIQINIGGVDVANNIVFDRDGYLYIFHLPIMTMTTEEIPTYYNLREQILSTFRFVE